MSTGNYGTEEITTAVKQIKTIFDHIQEAREEDSPGGKKIKLTEALGLVVKDSGKIIQLINSGEIIWEQIVDLDTGEAPEIIEALKQIYDPENPYVETASLKLVIALIAIKEAGEQFKLAKNWEQEETEES